MKTHNSNNTTLALLLALASLALLLVLALFVGPVSQASPGPLSPRQVTPTPYQVYLPAILKIWPVPNYRFGYGVVVNSISAYDLNPIVVLRAGIYTSWWVQSNPPCPNGMEYVQVVQLHQKKQWDAWDAPYVEPYTYTLGISWSEIARAATANPGSTWLLGNEIERVDWPGGQQNEILPEFYAQAYHELYTFIKQHDPTAWIGVGGVIQATPLRLKYLDRVWAEYQRRYGQKMPVDIWNVHGFALREKRYYPGCTDCWGADIPAGLTETVGILYDLRDVDNLDTFKQQIVAFRQWMKDKGERDKPLIVSEYGPLVPSDYVDEDGRAFTRERFRDFLYGTFDFMRTATDDKLGCPADKNRLVQQWVWFSLDCWPEAYGGNLFNPETRQITELGSDWVAYMNNPSRLPEPDVNVFPLRLSAEPSCPPFATAVTLTLRAEVANSGSLPVPHGVTVRFYDQDWTPVGETTVPVRCCGRTAIAQVIWPDVAPGVYQVHVRVDPDGALSESDENDNQLTGTILAACNRVYLPLATR